jgi:hypothetical protein
MPARCLQWASQSSRESLGEPFGTARSASDLLLAIDDAPLKWARTVRQPSLVRSSMSRSSNESRSDPRLCV